MFESVQNENEEYITGVSLASFDKENIKKMLFRKTPAGELPQYQTNLPLSEI